MARIVKRLRKHKLHRIVYSKERGEFISEEVHEPRGQETKLERHEPRHEPRHMPAPTPVEVSNGLYQVAKTELKIDLTDVTFIIPFKGENSDRISNLQNIVTYLLKLFKTNIIIIESDSVSKKEIFWFDWWNDSCEYKFIQETNGFHKCAILNFGYTSSNTRICAAYDADVLFEEIQYIHAVELLRKGEVNFAYPFNQPTRNIRRDNINNIFNGELDLKNISVLHDNHSLPPGGCFFLNKDVFLQCGFENENFIDWGYEDCERKMRIEKLGHTIGYVKGNLYHIEHAKSNGHNHYLHKNKEIYDNLKPMNSDQVTAYANGLYNYYLNKMSQLPAVTVVPENPSGDFVGSILDSKIMEIVDATLSKDKFPEYNDTHPDTLTDIIDRLILVHIRYWHLEDAMSDKTLSDSELASLRRTSESLFKEKRPMLVKIFDEVFFKLLNDK